MQEQKDYPETYEEFVEWFKTEDDCIEYIKKIRWSNGFICPKCTSSKAWETTGGLMHCSNCGHQTSIKNAMNFKNYETTWTWLQKLRRIMIRPGREQLNGTVEVDETYIRGPGTGVAGRETESKVLVVVAVEVREGKPGRVRFRCIKNASSEELIPFVMDNVDINSNVITDGWKGYSSLQNKGYEHEVKNISKSDKKANELLPGVHRVIGLVKRWLLGTRQGAVSEKHLQYYLDEYSFRFNRRLSKHRGKLFFRTIQQAVISKAITMDEITGKKYKHNM